MVKARLEVKSHVVLVAGGSLYFVLDVRKRVAIFDGTAIELSVVNAEALRVLAAYDVGRAGVGTVGSLDEAGLECSVEVFGDELSLDRRVPAGGALNRDVWVVDFYIVYNSAVGGASRRPSEVLVLERVSKLFLEAANGSDPSGDFCGVVLGVFLRRLHGKRALLQPRCCVLRW